MAWTPADLTLLDAAILAHGTGKITLSITFADRTVTFQTATLDERLKLRALIVAELDAAAGTQKNYRLAATSKGV